MIIKSDLSAFQAALRAVVRDSKKAEADIINKALKDVAFRAASFTPKTTAAKIRAELPKQLISRIAAKHLKKKQGKFSKEELKETVAAIRKRRRSGIGGLRAGWIPAITALGGNYRGANRRPNGSASRGIAKKAGPFRLAGLIRNTVFTTRFSDGSRRGAGVIQPSIDGLRQAIVFVTRDRLLYAERKRTVGTVLKRNSDK